MDNDITHGKHRIMTEEIAITGFCLCGIIYFCVLERIGISREKIHELRKYKLLH